MLFKPLNQFLGCHDSKLALVFLKEQLISWQIDFLKIRHKNVEYFNLVHAHKLIFFFAIAFPNSFLAHFLSFFPACLLSLLFACHILSGCRKTFSVNYGKAWTLVNLFLLQFYYHFCTKADNVVFKFVRSECP